MSIAYAIFYYVGLSIVTLIVFLKMLVLSVMFWLFYHVGVLLGFTVEDE